MLVHVFEPLLGSVPPADQDVPLVLIAVDVLPVAIATNVPLPCTTEE